MNDRPSVSTPRRIVSWLSILALIAVLAASLPAGAAVPATPASGSRFVRLPAEFVTQATTLGLNPKVAVHYGSFHWLELSEADFTVLSASGIPFTADENAGKVQVREYLFDPVNEGLPVLPDAMRVMGDGPALRLVQFVGPTNDAWLSRLSELGLPALQYYPFDAFLTWGTTDQLRQTESYSFVRWYGDFYPAYKINRDLEGRTGRIENVDVTFYNDGRVQDTLAQLQKLGARLIQYFPSQPDKAFYDAIVTLDASALPAAAQLPTVLSLSYASPQPQLDDEMSSQIVAGNYSGAGVPFTGYNTWLSTIGYNGAGVIWATIDTGVDYDHPDFAGRIVGGYEFPGSCNIPGQPGSDCAGGGHGTHVTGIIGGDAAAGFSDPQGFKYGLGVAPGYSIFAMNSLSASAWPPAGGWQEHSKRAVLGNAIGGNNSWTTGEGTNHGYQASERTHDQMVLDGNFDTTTIAEPFIEVFSAGNSGPGASTLTAPKEGKNLIIVASSQNYRVGSINNISSFSSRGPSVDGRIVPTITTPGEQIASARNDTGGSCATAISGTNNYYAYCSGTSMAAPHTSGSITLVTEWWRSFNAGANPSAAMAKALLVNGATDMGTADIPNFNEGWGRVNLSNVIANGVNMVYKDQTTVFGNTGESWTTMVGVSDPTKPVKITIAWSDAPGAIGANPALVNNLDLTVTDGATTYKGNVFSSGWSTTGGSADIKNNLENVYLQSHGSSVTIRVDATNIAGDAILYNTDLTDQSFALVCYNCVLNPDFTLNTTPANQSICAPANAVYNVDVGSLMGYVTPVTLSATGVPAGATSAFGSNPVTPPGATTLTIGNTGAVAPGSYAVNVVGVSASGTHTNTVGLNVATAAPGAPNLTAPANGATNVSSTPTFTWDAVSQAQSYDIQVATDAGFANIVASASGLSGTSWTSNVTLNTNTMYYWRVWASNACGTGAYSAVFSFTTAAAPGDCSAGTTPNILYQYGFESGAAGWTTSGTGNTWAIASSNPHSGASHYHANDPATVSDQRLASPAVALPTGQNPITVKFWHAPNLEPSGTTACYDGGILESSTDGGATWAQVPNASLLVGPYRGLVSSSFSNPLAGLQAWCGVTTYMNTIADVSSLAGQTAQFRMRLGSDTSVSRPGWDVDDVMVQSCQPTGVTPTPTATTAPPTSTPTTAPPTPTPTTPPTGVELSSLDRGTPASNLWLPVALAFVLLLVVGLTFRQRAAR